MFGTVYATSLFSLMALQLYQCTEMLTLGTLCVCCSSFFSHIILTAFAYSALTCGISITQPLVRDKYITIWTQGEIAVAVIRLLL